ncbi:MAG: hypothetical protein IJ308_04295 [Clostridia bacterium]|nr:hypothetical protein [Clostridia bacterium]
MNDVKRIAERWLRLAKETRRDSKRNGHNGRRGGKDLYHGLLDKLIQAKGV